MKIAIFHELDRLSGAKKVIDEYARILKKNYSLDLYYVGYEKEKEISDFTSISFFKLKKISQTGFLSRLQKDSIQLIELYNLHRKIAELINSKEYDFIFVNPSKFTQAPFILRFLKAKSVYFSQETLRIIYDEKVSNMDGLPLQNKIYEYVNRRIRKQIDYINIKKANVVLSNSEFSKRNIKKAYGISSQVCYLGVDTNKFKPQDKLRTNDILFIGEENEIEGYDLLESVMDLFSKKPKIRIVSRKNRGITEEKLINEYSSSKIYLALSRNEPFGLTTVESMACGTPVVALSEGGFVESVVSSKTGYLVNSDKNEIKDKILKLLQNTSLRESLGKEGRQHVLGKFTWEKSVERFNQIIKKNI